MDYFNLLYPESFNEFFSWKWFEKLRYKNAPYIPIIGESPFYDKSDVAWHMDIPTVFPHTKRFRALRAICKNDLEELQKTLDEGFDINAEVDLQEGKTALGVASLLERTMIMNYLIMRGANIDAGDKHGNTPLHDAVSRANFESIIVLTQNGASPNIKNKFKTTPMSEALEKDLGHIVNLMKGVKEKGQYEGVLPKYTVSLKFEDLLQKNSKLHGQRSHYSEGVNYPFNSLSSVYVFNLYNEDKSPLA